MGFEYSLRNVGNNIELVHSSARVVSSVSDSASFVQKSAIYTILVNDKYIEATANSFTITLPTAVGIPGQDFIIKNSGAGTITLDGDGTETIDGNLTVSILTNTSLTVVSNGSNWIII